MPQVSTLYVWPLSALGQRNHNVVNRSWSRSARAAVAVLHRRGGDGTRRP